MQNPITPPRLFVLSGAGLSAESGISTFRSKDGIWSKESLNKVCNLDTWLDNRDAVYDFYNARLEDMGVAQPNDAHKRLATWQSRWGGHRVELLTQNVDDLLEKAGASEVIHLHGDIHHYQCTACNHRFPRETPTWDRHLACPQCGDGRAVKPGVVFFNQEAPAYDNLKVMRESMTDEDLFLAVGTSFVVLAPVQVLPRRRWNAHPRSFLVDPKPTEDVFGVVCAMTATQGLAELEDRISLMMDGKPVATAGQPASMAVSSFVSRLRALFQ